MEMPHDDNLKDVQESVQERGRWKTFVDQIQSHWLELLTLPLLVIYGLYSQSRFSKIEEKITTISNENTVNVLTNQENENKQDLGITLGTNTEFNPEGWLIDSFELDKEGFYCSLTGKFDYWSMWSKDSFSPTVNQIKIKLLVKSRSNSKTPPTIAISYGEYKTNFSPIQFYRLNIFDTDLKSLRLYNDKDKSTAQEWLESEPDLTSEMSITLSPRNSNPNSRILNLNPSLEYAISGDDKPYIFTPKETFQVVLPTVGLEDGTVRKQIGIGSSKSTCFKPVAVEIK